MSKAQSNTFFNGYPISRLNDSSSSSGSTSPNLPRPPRLPVCSSPILYNNNHIEQVPKLPPKPGQTGGTKRKLPQRNPSRLYRIGNVLFWYILKIETQVILTIFFQKSKSEFFSFFTIFLQIVQNSDFDVNDSLNSPISRIFPIY